MADFITPQQLVDAGAAVIRAELDPDGTAPPDLEPGSDLTTLLSVAAGMITPLLAHHAERVAARTLGGSTGADLVELAQDTYRDPGKKPAAAAVGTAYLSRTGTSATTIPAGSRFSTPKSGSTAAVVFSADADVPVGASVLVATVPITCLVDGVAGNVDLADLTVIVDSLPDSTWTLYVPTTGDPVLEGATDPDVIGGGAPEESDDELRARLRATSPLDEAPGTFAGVLYAARTVPGVLAVSGIEPGDGTIVLYVGDASYRLPSALKADVEALMPKWRVGGGAVRVRAYARVVVVNTLVIRMTRPLSEFDAADLKAKAIAAVLRYYAEREHADEVIGDGIKAEVARAFTGIQQIALSTSLGSDVIRPADGTYSGSATMVRYVSDAANVFVSFLGPQTA